MYLEIVSPEATLFAGNVTSVTVPGVEGEFQMLKDHAAIISLLQEGDVKFEGNAPVSEMHASKFAKGSNGKTIFHITSGTVEMKDNKVIVLAD
ncbi:hypothetical protein LCGC14_0776070 [marine sediment metagenome]|uniref:F0F1 ATP synthase subunit epsilon n=2 Tax=root TaxID=1 RepID=A0A831QNX7_9FLAO|nr:F0F1 ATP synthase subunit epsilon [Pricia sp.]HEA20382.1 F0F1 ATP synthase subunit epsilon [Pricia antarctica]